MVVVRNAEHKYNKNFQFIEVDGRIFCVWKYGEVYKSNKDKRTSTYFCVCDACMKCRMSCVFMYMC